MRIEDAFTTNSNFTRLIRYVGRDLQVDRQMTKFVYQMGRSDPWADLYIVSDAESHLYILWDLA